MSDALVVAATRKDDLQIMKVMDVLYVVPTSVADNEDDGIWVDCRWVMTNKGSYVSPVAKARLVAREFADTKRNDLYAGTPGRNVVKLGLAMAAIKRNDNDAHNNSMAFDVETAFLYGKGRRNILAGNISATPRANWTTTRAPRCAIRC